MIIKQPLATVYIRIMKVVSAGDYKCGTMNKNIWYADALCSIVIVRLCHSGESVIILAS